MLSWHQQFCIRRAADIVRRGGVIAYPAEGVWGLGCDPWNAQAVAYLLALKRRPAHKGLILVAATIEQFASCMAPLDELSRARLMKSWPGPQTWLVPASAEVPIWIRGKFDTVALRVSNHPVIRALCTELGGPMVSTSANPAGANPARALYQARRYFLSSIELYVPGALGNNRRPTAIRHLLSGKEIRA